MFNYIKSFFVTNEVYCRFFTTFGITFVSLKKKKKKLLTSFPFTSSLRVTTVRAVGSRLDADRTSLSCASFFSRVSASADSFFSSRRFLKLLFCWTSWMALTNLRYKSSRSSWVWENKMCSWDTNAPGSGLGCKVKVMCQKLFQPRSWHNIFEVSMFYCSRVTAKVEV